MKNLYKIIIPAVALMFYASCSPTSSLSITKRHYNSGYYVDHVSSKTAAAPVAKANTSEQLAKEEFSGKEVVTPAQSGALNTYASKEKVSAKELIKSVASNSTAKSHKAKQVNESIVETQTNSLGAKPTAVEALDMYAKNPLSLRSISHIKHSKAFVDGDESARSLLWIIILVILILWLVGLLDGGFGAGPLINLLLVIALILFILWLLRIL
jgi:uncharacterized membrane protein